MSSSVSVLAPNGRRQTVKCTPNTTIMQILEEVCHKQGFKPEEYDIKHHNKVLDTTTTFRFSGLPNNAQLELTTATKARLDSEVILALNLEDGNRVIGNFLPDETISQVLVKLCPNDVKLEANPVVIYMRNEIYGSSLEKTTLRSLGLRGGRAMMRLVHKSPTELKTQANVSAPLPVKVAEEKPYRAPLKTETVTQEPSITVSRNLDNNDKPKPVQKKNETDFLKLAREKRKLNFYPLSKDSDTDPQKAKVRPKMEPKEEAMEVDVDKSPPPTACPIKKNEEPEEDFIFLGERNAMLFSLESARSVPSDDLPDDFFELTIDDAKKIFSDIKRKRQEMENAALMTAAMRTLEESKKQLRHLNKYKQSVIRVQFPDRTILQGTFKPIETIRDVMEFVKIYLQNHNSNFYLYTTPPKSVLNEGDRLVEVGCVPGALLHLGSHCADNKDISLKDDLRDKFTTNSKASLAASKMRKKNTRIESNVLYDEMEEDNSVETVSDQSAPGPSSQPTSYERKVIKSSEKVPKWFKPSK